MSTLLVEGTRGGGQYRIDSAVEIQNLSQLPLLHLPKQVSQPPFSIFSTCTLCSFREQRVSSLQSKGRRTNQDMSTEGASCRNLTSTQVSVCNTNEKQAGSAITWCSDECFYSIKCCQYYSESVELVQPPANNNDNPPRPDYDTTYDVVSEQQQRPGSYHLLGSQVHASSNKKQSHPPPPPSSPATSRVGVGIGFALVVIAIGAVIVWKRDSDKNVSTIGDSSKTATNDICNTHKSHTHKSPIRRDEQTQTNPRVMRRGRSSNGRRRRSSNNNSSSSEVPHRETKEENRTIYDSDDSLDIDFVINRRMSIDPVNSDSDSEFSVKSMSI